MTLVNLYAKDRSYLEVSSSFDFQNMDGHGSFIAGPSFDIWIHSKMGSTTEVKH